MGYLDTRFAPPEIALQNPDDPRAREGFPTSRNADPVVVDTLVRAVGDRLTRFVHDLDSTLWRDPSIATIRTQAGFQIEANAMATNVVTAINDSTGAIDSGQLIRGAGLRADADPGSGVASTATYTNSENTGTGRSTGTGTVLFADAINRNNAGFVKVYLGTTAYYIPVFGAN